MSKLAHATLARADQIPKGIGLSVSLSETARVCRWRIEDRQPAWRELGYVQVGIYAHEEVPGELVPLIRRAGLGSIAHLLEVNLIHPLSAQRDRLDALLLKLAALEPDCVEEDMGLWCWGETVLEQHMLPPSLDEENAAQIARNAVEIRAAVGVPFLVENPPIYFPFGELDILTFMSRVAERARCPLVLDIGHLIGYCAVTGREPEEYLAAWDGIEHVRELHIAGYDLFPDQVAPQWYDNHPQPITDYTLDLVDLACRRAGRALPITLEQEGATWARIVEHVKLVAGRVNSRQRVAS